MGLESLVEPLQHGFMRNAYAAIVLVGIICGVMGVFVTLRGLAFMGDAIAHAVFPGVVIAYVFGGNYVVGALIAAMVVSLAIGLVTQSGLVRNDTAIGVFFVGAFALGVAIISSQRSYARDVASLLFGSILGVSRGDLILTALVGCGVAVALWLFRREIVTISFDRTFAQASGLNLWVWDQLFLLLLALTIVTAARGLWLELEHPFLGSRLARLHCRLGRPVNARRHNPCSSIQGRGTLAPAGTLAERLRAAPARQWSGQRDSNTRPPAPKAGALPG